MSANVDITADIYSSVEKAPFLFDVPDTCRKVCERARFVKIDTDKIAHLCSQWAEKPIEVPPWDDSVHWSGKGENDPLLANYILVLDCLNFCFWSDKGQEKWTIDYKGQTLGGYQALAASLRRAVEEGIPILDATWLENVKESDLEHIFRGKAMIPLLPRRVKNLNECGRVLNSKYQGQFANAIKLCDNKAVKLAQLIAKDFGCFKDMAYYDDFWVCFYKRAQITVVDLAGSFNNKGLGYFTDIGDLTAFADYKVPQVLRALGILIYDPKLAAKVDQQILIVPQSPEEIEIRAGMVWAVELISRQFAKLGVTCRPYEIDWLMWNLGQNPLPLEKPYHRVRTYFY